MKKVQITADKCIRNLVKNGVSYSEAENSVLEILKENTLELKKGKFSEVCKTLSFIFLN
jgi:hypothetical protein